MLVLASQSATRKTLLNNAGIRFLAQAAPIDERRVEAGMLDSGADSAAVALGLARAKAEAVARIRPDAWVIGADQTAALDGQILHKPADGDEARAQLLRLRGRTHRLDAAVVLVQGGVVRFETVETARLTMHEYSEAELDAVLGLEGEAILGSVGAYRLEGPSIRLFSSVEGDYFTILGLPLLPLLSALRQLAPHLLELRP